MTTITLTGGCLGDETLRVRCDLRQAASPVEACYHGDKWAVTQYQCADAQHTIRGLTKIARELAAEAMHDDARACVARAMEILTKPTNAPNAEVANQ